MLTWGPRSAGWLSGRYSAPSDVDLQAGRVALQNHKFDPAMPGNAAKLAATNELKKVAADLGRPLTHLALAFVRSHPAVTSAIIGSRTPEQLADLLAGVDLNAVDPDYTPPALADKSLRRR